MLIFLGTATGKTIPAKPLDYKRGMIFASNHFAAAQHGACLVQWIEKKAFKPGGPEMGAPAVWCTAIVSGRWSHETSRWTLIPSNLSPDSRATVKVLRVDVSLVEFAI